MKEVHDLTNKHKENLKKFGVENTPPLFAAIETKDLNFPLPPVKRLNLKDVRNLEGNSTEPTKLKYVILENGELIITNNWSEPFPIPEKELGFCSSLYIHPANKLDIKGKRYPFALHKNEIIIFDTEGKEPLWKKVLVKHPEIANLRPVLFAGDLYIKDGKLIYIDNWTGHYLCYSENQAVIVEHIFRKNGFLEAKFRDRVKEEYSRRYLPDPNIINRDVRITEQRPRPISSISNNNLSKRKVTIKSGSSRQSLRWAGQIKIKKLLKPITLNEITYLYVLDGIGILADTLESANLALEGFNQSSVLIQQKIKKAISEGVLVVFSDQLLTPGLWNCQNDLRQKLKNNSLILDYKTNGRFFGISIEIKPTGKLSIPDKFVHELKHHAVFEFNYQLVERGLAALHALTEQDRNALALAAFRILRAKYAVTEEDRDFTLPTDDAAALKSLSLADRDRLALLAIEMRPGAVELKALNEHPDLLVLLSLKQEFLNPILSGELPGPASDPWFFSNNKILGEHFSRANLKVYFEDIRNYLRTNNLKLTDLSKNVNSFQIIFTFPLSYFRTKLLDPFHQMLLDGVLSKDTFEKMKTLVLKHGQKFIEENKGNPLLAITKDIKKLMPDLSLYTIRNLVSYAAFATRMEIPTFFEQVNERMGSNLTSKHAPLTTHLLEKLQNATVAGLSRTRETVYLDNKTPSNNLEEVNEHNSVPKESTLNHSSTESKEVTNFTDKPPIKAHKEDHFADNKDNHKNDKNKINDHNAQLSDCNHNLYTIDYNPSHSSLVYSEKLFNYEKSRRIVYQSLDSYIFYKLKDIDLIDIPKLAGNDKVINEPVAKLNLPRMTKLFNYGYIHGSNKELVKNLLKASEMIAHSKSTFIKAIHADFLEKANNENYKIVIIENCKNFNISNKDILVPAVTYCDEVTRHPHLTVMAGDYDIEELAILLLNQETYVVKKFHHFEDSFQSKKQLEKIKNSIHEDICFLGEKIENVPLTVRLIKGDASKKQQQFVMNNKEIHVLLSQNRNSISHAMIMEYQIGFSKTVDGQQCYIELPLNPKDIVQQNLIDLLNQYLPERAFSFIKESYKTKGGINSYELEVDVVFKIQHVLKDIIEQQKGNSFNLIEESTCLFDIAHDNLAFLNSLNTDTFDFFDLFHTTMMELEFRFPSHGRLFAPHSWKNYLENVYPANSLGLVKLTNPVVADKNNYPYQYLNHIYFESEQIASNAIPEIAECYTHTSALANRVFNINLKLAADGKIKIFIDDGRIVSASETMGRGVQTQDSEGIDCILPNGSKYNAYAIKIGWQTNPAIVNEYSFKELFYHENLHQYFNVISDPIASSPCRTITQSKSLRSSYMTDYQQYFENLPNFRYVTYPKTASSITSKVNELEMIPFYSSARAKTNHINFNHYFQTGCLNNSKIFLEDREWRVGTSKNKKAIHFNPPQLNQSSIILLSDTYRFVANRMLGVYSDFKQYSNYHLQGIPHGTYQYKKQLVRILQNAEAELGADGGAMKIMYPQAFNVLFPNTNAALTEIEATNYANYVHNNFNQESVASDSLPYPRFAGKVNFGPPQPPVYKTPLLFSAENLPVDPFREPNTYWINKGSLEGVFKNEKKWNWFKLYGIGLMNQDKLLAQKWLWFDYGRLSFWKNPDYIHNFKQSYKVGLPIIGLAALDCGFQVLESYRENPSGNYWKEGSKNFVINNIANIGYSPLFITLGPLAGPVILAGSMPDQKPNLERSLDQLRNFQPTQSVPENILHRHALMVNAEFEGDLYIANSLAKPIVKPFKAIVDDIRGLFLFHKNYEANKSKLQSQDKVEKSKVDFAEGYGPIFLSVSQRSTKNNETEIKSKDQPKTSLIKEVLPIINQETTSHPNSFQIKDSGENKMPNEIIEPNQLLNELQELKKQVDFSLQNVTDTKQKLQQAEQNKNIFSNVLPYAKALAESVYIYNQVKHDDQRRKEANHHLEEQIKKAEDEQGFKFDRRKFEIMQASLPDIQSTILLQLGSSIYKDTEEQEAFFKKLENKIEHLKTQVKLFSIQREDLHANIDNLYAKQKELLSEIKGIKRDKLLQYSGAALRIASLISMKNPIAAGAFAVGESIINIFSSIEQKRIEKETNRNSRKIEKISRFISHRDNADHEYGLLIQNALQEINALENYLFTHAHERSPEEQRKILRDKLTELTNKQATLENEKKELGGSLEELRQKKAEYVLWLQAPRHCRPGKIHTDQINALINDIDKKIERAIQLPTEMKDTEASIKTTEEKRKYEENEEVKKTKEWIYQRNIELDKLPGLSDEAKAAKKALLYSHQLMIEDYENKLALRRYRVGAMNELFTTSSHLLAALDPLLGQFPKYTARIVETAYEALEAYDLLCKEVIPKFKQHISDPANLVSWYESIKSDKVNVYEFLHECISPSLNTLAKVIGLSVTLLGYKKTDIDLLRSCLLSALNQVSQNLHEHLGQGFSDINSKLRKIELQLKQLSTNVEKHYRSLDSLILHETKMIREELSVGFDKQQKENYEKNQSSRGKYIKEIDDLLIDKRQLLDTLSDKEKTNLEETLICLGTAKRWLTEKAYTKKYVGIDEMRTLSLYADLEDPRYFVDGIARGLNYEQRLPNLPLYVTASQVIISVLTKYFSTNPINANSAENDPSSHNSARNFCLHTVMFEVINQARDEGIKLLKFLHKLTINYDWFIKEIKNTLQTYQEITKLVTEKRSAYIERIRRQREPLKRIQTTQNLVIY